jgi:hypothetical protein
MINTVMALWNQKQGAKRQRRVKVLLTLLLITGSAFLFLFTLNSSVWSPFAGAQQQRTVREEQPIMSSAHGVVVAVNTPNGDVGTVGITPTATASSLKVPVHSPYVQIPAVVVQPRITTGSLNPVPYAGNTSPENGRSEQPHVHSKVVLIKGKRHLVTKPTLKATITPTSPISQSTPAVSPGVTPTPQITIPTATVITIIVSPPDGTTVRNPTPFQAGACQNC